MAEQRSTKFEIEIDGVKPAALSFLAFHAEERLFECYRVAIDVLCSRLDPALLLGRKATLYVRFEQEVERCFHGIVWSAELEPLDARVFQLRVELVPRMLQLSLGKNSRMFRDCTLLDVVKQVLLGAKLPKDAFEFQASEGPVHETVIQHAESDYDFIRRLLFEEGVGFILQNDPDQERVIFFDGDSSSIAVDGLETLVDRRRKDIRHDTVFDLREEARATSDGVMLREYDLKNPARSPDADVSLHEPPKRQVYEHPGGHLSLDQRAQRMLERLSMSARRFHGASYWPHLEPGRHVQLESDVRAGLAAELLLVRVEHEGQLRADKGGAAYRNRWSAIPKSVPFRPELAPAAPAPEGTQRAFVTGPGGQELHGDELGRVKVRFPWDRSGRTDDRSSSFVRVGQVPMAGSMIIPRVGFEVLVGHELGDIDRPYVTGHMYNEESGPPYGSAQLTTSAMQSATTEGGAGKNELRFGDSAGAEEVMINASFDMQVSADNTLKYNVGNDETLEVGANVKRSVKADSFSSIGGSRTLSIGAMQTINVGGNFDEGVGGDSSVSIGAAHTVTVSGDRVENVTGTLTRNISAVQTIIVVDGFTRQIGGSSSVNVGAAWAETVAKSKSTTVSGARVEDVAALKMISAKNVSITTEAAYGEDVASQKISTGKDKSDKAGGTLKLDAKGGIEAEAADMSFTADDELTLCAGDVTITLKKTGEIKVKADKITIKNSKALKQVTHKTN